VFLELSEQKAALAMSELDNEWLVMVDGAARGNPGHAGCGAVILDENGKVVKGLSCYLRTSPTISRSMKVCSWDSKRSFRSAKNVSVQSDSQLCWSGSSMANTVLRMKS